MKETGLNRVRSLLSLFFSVVCGLMLSSANASGQMSDFDIKMELNKWQEVNLSQVQSELSKLPSHEQAEQVRDWMALALLKRIDTSKTELVHLAFDIPSSRVEALSSTYSYKYGPVRSFILPGHESTFLALVPADKRTRDEHLGRIADEVRMVTGKKPRTAFVVEYDFDISIPMARLKYAGKVPGDVLFSLGMGYAETRIFNIEDLKNFLKTIDALTAFEAVPHGLLVGGRSIPDKRYVAISLDDLAAIYQADRRLQDNFIERVHAKGVREEYNSFLRQQIRDNFSEISLRNPGKTFEDIVAQAKLEFTYDKFKGQFIKALLPTVGANIGFSLDPHPQAVEVAHLLRKALSGDKSAMSAFAKEQSELMSRSQLYQKLEESFDLFAQYHDRFEKRSLKREGSSTNHPNITSAGETDLTTLIGLNDGDIVKASGPEHGRQTPSAQNVPSVKDAWEEFKRQTIAEFVELHSAQFIEHLLHAVDSQKSPVGKVVEGLSNNKWTSYRTYRRYLQGDAEDSAMKGTKGHVIRDVQEMLREVGFLDSPTSGTLDDSTTSALKRYQERIGLKTGGKLNLLTWKSLLSQSENKREEFQTVDAFLKYIDRTTSYQCSRYDGDLRGTEVGMTLFYTDLMMKLWSMNYPNSFPPIQVPGFIPITRFPVSPVFWDEVRRYPATRGWLGPLEEGYDLFNDDSGILFGPVVTKLYNASSSDLYPGQEVPANAPSERFSREWNLRYLEVADYEAQFHRLNEIMKWSIAIRWLKDKNISGLGFLRSYKVSHSKVFGDWLVKNNKSLKSQAHLPFVKKIGREASMECLALLKSDYFMGLGGAAQIHGGVSLASPKDISSRAGVQAKRSNLPLAILRKGFDYKQVKHSEDGPILTFLDGRSVRVDTSRGRVEFINKTNATFRGKDGEFNHPKVIRTFDKNATALRVSDEVSSYNLGELQVLESGGVLTLQHTDKEIGKAYNVVKQMLSRFTDREEYLIANQHVEDLLRLPDRNGVLIKLTDTDHWLLVTSPETPIAKKYKHLIRLGDMENDAPQIRQAGFINAQEADAILSDVKWQKLRPADFGWGDQISKSPITMNVDKMIRKNLLAVFDRDGPKEGTAIQIVYKEAEFDATVDEGVLFLQYSSGPLMDNLLKSKSLRDGLDTRDLLFIDRYAKDIEEGTTLVRLALDGNSVLFKKKGGARPVIPENLRPVLFQKTKSIQGIVIHDSNSQNMTIRRDGLIEVSQNAPREQVNELLSVMELLDQDAKSLKDVAELGTLNRGVVSHFLRLPEDMRSSYVSFSQLKALPRGYAVVDLGGTRENPHWIFSSQVGKVEVRDLPESLMSHYSEIKDGIENVYRGTEAMDLEALKVMTKPYADFLESIAQTTQAQIIVTRGDEIIDPNLVWQLHSKSSQVQFKRDQSSLEKSILNAETPIGYSDTKTLIGTSVSFFVPPSQELKNIREIASNVEDLGQVITSNLTWHEFQDLLMDKDRTQIHLVIRVDDGQWFVFRDRRVHWFDVLVFGESIPEKDLLHLITNADKQFVELLANSGKFKRLMLSQYALGDRLSFERALENLQKFLEIAGQEFVAFDAQEYEALLAEYPSLTSTLRLYEYRHGNNILIEASPLLRSQGGQIPESLISTIRKRLANRDKSSKQIDLIISKIGRDKVESFRSASPSLRQLLLSFPKLKVQHLQEDRTITVM